MQPVSSQFTATIYESHQVAVVAQVLNRGVVVLPPSASQPIHLLSGTVSFDVSQATRRTMQCTLVDEYGYLAAQAIPTGQLTPFGAEMTLAQGITYDDGTVETIPLGVFALTSVIPTYSATGGLTYVCQGSDRSYTIGLRALTAPVSFAAGTTLNAALQRLFTGILPNGAQLILAPNTAVLAAVTLQQGDNPWTDGVSLANGAGFQLYVDVHGNVQMQPIPDPTTQAAVWTLASGESSGLQTIARPMASGASNDFYMIYEGSATTSTANPPTVARAYDNNPQSAMYIGGLYGDVPTFTSTPTLASGTAQQAADLLLAQSEGSVDQVQITCLPSPQLDALDVIYINVPEINVVGNYVIQSVQMPLTVNDGLMSLVANRATSPS